MDKKILPNEVLLEEAGRLLDEGREVTRSQANRKARRESRRAFCLLMQAGA